MSKKIKYNDEVHEHISFSIRQYPTLYNCRTDVLEHMFCVLGNGYEWIDGRLVTERPRKVFKNSNEMIKDQKDQIYKISKDMLSALPVSKLLKSQAHNAIEEFTLRFKFNNAHILALIPWDHDGDYYRQAGLTDMKYHYFSEGHRIYPMVRQYSKMLSIPDDAKPEWVDACREMCIEIFKSDISIHSHKSYTSTENKKIYKENIKIADDTLKMMLKKFGPSTKYANSHKEFLKN